jgi:hypothetical protein
VILILKKGTARPEGLAWRHLLRVGLQRMVIVTEFGCPVHEYAESFGQLVFPRPKVCPHCHVLDVLIGHGFYERKALGQTQVYVLRIKRWPKVQGVSADGLAVAQLLAVLSPLPPRGDPDGRCYAV